MNFGGQFSKKDANRLATARLDQAPTGSRLTKFLPIPLGFEDETGFHYGLPSGTQANGTQTADSENTFTNPYPF